MVCPCVLTLLETNHIVIFMVQIVNMFNIIALLPSPAPKSMVYNNCNIFCTSVRGHLGCSYVNKLIKHLVTTIIHPACSGCPPQDGDVVYEPDYYKYVHE